MEKSKAFLTVGALVLAISAIFAKKVATKINFTIKTGCSINGVYVVVAPESIWTTNSIAGNKAFATLYTATLTKVLSFTLYTTINKTKTLYY